MKLFLLIGILIIPSVAFAEFNYSIKWDLNDFGEDVLFAIIEYESECKNKNFIQIAKVIDNENKDLVWDLASGEMNRNETSVDGFFVDIYHHRCQKGKACSPFYKDYFPEGENSKNKIKMIDAPFGWSRFEEIRLETCVFCSDTNRFEGCISWGGTFPLFGDKRIIHNVEKINVSNNFIKALKLFYNFYEN